MDQMRILKSLDCWMSRGTNAKYHELKMGETTLLVLHGALQTGIEKVDWQLNKFMKAIWQLLYNSLARRDIHFRNLGFPLR